MIHRLIALTNVLRPPVESTAYIERAESLYRDLDGNYPDSWLLHGDLHHENLLRDQDGFWVAIDPKGVMGPRVVEYGRFMHNFMTDEESESRTRESILLTRAETLSGEFSARELLAAGFVDLVLSVCWTLNRGTALNEPSQVLLDDYYRLCSQ